MGMYSNMTNNDLTVKKEELIEFCENQSNNVYIWAKFFYDKEMNDETKFYSYWNEETIKALNEICEKELIIGECEMEFEDGDWIQCDFSKEYGFRYKVASREFPMDWTHT